MHAQVQGHYNSTNTILNLDPLQIYRIKLHITFLDATRSKGCFLLVLSDAKGFIICHVQKIGLL